MYQYLPYNISWGIDLKRKFITLHLIINALQRPSAPHDGQISNNQIKSNSIEKPCCSSKASLACRTHCDRSSFQCELKGDIELSVTLHRPLSAACGDCDSLILMIHYYKKKRETLKIKIVGQWPLMKMSFSNIII